MHPLLLWVPKQLSFSSLHITVLYLSVHPLKAEPPEEELKQCNEKRPFRWRNSCTIPEKVRWCRWPSWSRYATKSVTRCWVHWNVRRAREKVVQIFWMISIKKDKIKATSRKVILYYTYVASKTFSSDVGLPGRSLYLARITVDTCNQQFLTCCWTGCISTNDFRREHITQPVALHWMHLTNIKATWCGVFACTVFVAHM